MHSMTRAELWEAIANDLMCPGKNGLFNTEVIVDTEKQVRLKLSFCILSLRSDRWVQDNVWLPERRMMRGSLFSARNSWMRGADVDPFSANQRSDPRDQIRIVILQTAMCDKFRWIDSVLSSYEAMS